jgi:protein-export membrane protein SecD
MSPNKKRTNGKTKSVIALCVLLAVTILLGIVGFTGLSFLNVSRWMPTASTDPEKWPEALPLGLDLQGGVYVEFTGEVPEGSDAGFDELAEGTMRIIRDRLANVGYTEATVQKIGTNGIRVEVPIKTTQLATTAASTASTSEAAVQADTTEPEETAPESTTETAPETDAEVKTETEAATTEAEVKAEAETAVADAEAEVKAEAENAVADAEAEVKAEAENAVTDAEAEVKAETEATDTETEAKAETEAAANTAITTNSVIQQVLDLIGDPAEMYFLDKDYNVFMSGDMVKSATYSYGENGHEIAFELTAEGKDIFAQKTMEAAPTKDHIIIVLDGVVLVDAAVQSAITDGRGVISGSYTQEEAKAVAAKIQSGALPLKLTRDKVDVVSATLGQDALSTSVIAALIGILLIMLLMIFRYRLNGVIASWALTIYVILLFAMIALFKVQLTLPGLAGVVLGIGMAVDANVIIFERFNEEARKGRSAKAAVRAGFKNAISAILDANVTTLIAAIVLLIFGTGSIQGFARTLLLGVVVSMITAILVTRFLMNRFVDAGCTSIGLYAKVKAEAEEEVAQ